MSEEVKDQEKNKVVQGEQVDNSAQTEDAQVEGAQAGQDPAQGSAEGQQVQTKVIDLSNMGKFDAAFIIGMSTFINFPFMVLQKTQYNDMSWNQLTAYFEDEEVFLAMDDEERVKLYNAVKDKVLKDEFGFQGFPVVLNKNETIEAALGVTRINEGIITVTEREDEQFVDMYSDNRHFYNDKRFAGLKTLNTILHETRHAYQAMRINKWFRDASSKNLSFAELSMLVGITCDVLKDRPKMNKKRHLDPKTYQYLMSHYEFDARRFANKKMTSLLKKGCFNNTELVQEFISQSELQEYAKMSIGSRDRKNLKCIRLEVELMKETLDYFKTNFDSEMCTDLFELVDKFDFNKYEEEMKKEYGRLTDSVRAYVGRFVDKCYKTPKLRKFIPAIKDIIKHEGLFGVVAAKDYIEIMENESKMARQEETIKQIAKEVNGEKHELELPERTEWMMYMRRLLHDKERPYEAEAVARAKARRETEEKLAEKTGITFKITDLGPEK